MNKIEDTDLRWLEIIFYCFCKSVFNKSQKIETVEDFIYGFHWTNMFDYDKLVKAIKEENILFNTNFIPSSYEFIVVMDTPNKRFKLNPGITFKLAKSVKLDYRATRRYTIKLKEELYHSAIIPKLQTRGIHKEIYGFLKAIQQFGDYTTKLVL